MAEKSSRKEVFRGSIRKEAVQIWNHFFECGLDLDPQLVYEAQSWRRNIKIVILFLYLTPFKSGLSRNQWRVVSPASNGFSEWDMVSAGCPF